MASSREVTATEGREVSLEGWVLPAQNVAHHSRMESAGLAL